MQLLRDQRLADICAALFSLLVCFLPHSQSGRNSQGGRLCIAGDSVAVLITTGSSKGRCTEQIFSSFIAATHSGRGHLLLAVAHIWSCDHRRSECGRAESAGVAGGGGAAAAVCTISEASTAAARGAAESPPPAAAKRQRWRSAAAIVSLFFRLARFLFHLSARRRRNQRRVAISWALGAISENKLASAKGCCCACVAARVAGQSLLCCRRTICWHSCI